MKPLVAAVLLAVGCTANQPPLVGNGGYTPYFDWNTHSDAMTLHWTDIPKTELTMEFWYMVTDPYLYATTLFSYGAYNAEGRHSAGGDIYEQANEVRLQPPPAKSSPDQTIPILAAPRPTDGFRPTD